MSLAHNKEPPTPEKGTGGMSLAHNKEPLTPETALLLLDWATFQQQRLKTGKLVTQGLLSYPQH